MAVVVYGTALCGQVDRVDGLFYVSTQFFHVDHVPLFPRGSYVVIAGSEKRGGGFRGQRIGLSWKSVLVGYLRGWLALTAILGAFFGIGMLVFPLIGKDNVILFFVTLGMTVLVALCFAYVMRTERWFFVPVQAVLLFGSLALCHAIQNAAAFNLPVPPKQEDVTFGMAALLVGNAALLLFSLMRLLTPASYLRALVLAETVGVPAEVIEAHFDRQRSSQDDVIPGL